MKPQRHTGVQLINMKWDGGNGTAGLAITEAFIRTKRQSAVTPLRSKIDKSHNYKFREYVEQ